MHRRTDNGWETRQGNTWQRSGESVSDRSATQQRPSTNNTQQRPSTTNNRSSTQQRSYNHSMERDYSARQRGASRAGGYRGGGGRRR